MAKIQVDSNNKAIMLNNKALLAQELIGIQREISNGVFQNIANYDFKIPDGVTNIGRYSLYGAFYGDTGLKSVDFNDVTTLGNVGSATNAFYGCTNLTNVSINNLTTVSGTSVLASAFFGCTGLTSLDLSSITTISGSSGMSTMCRGCTNLASIDVSGLTTINGANALTTCFRQCTSLTSVDFPNLVTISSTGALNSTFYGCTGLTSATFPKLKTIGSNVSTAISSQFSSCFNGCTNLTTLTFPELEKIYCTGAATVSLGTFANNDTIQKMYFPKLDTITYGSGASSTNQNACKNVFAGCSALTELHFAEANQSAIEATDGYPTAWGRGAGNVTIYFDL